MSSRSPFIRKIDQVEDSKTADLVGLFPGNSTLPSCLAPDSKFAGILFCGVEVEDLRVWSDCLPLTNSNEKWNKPRLLAKVTLNIISYEILS